MKKLVAIMFAVFMLAGAAHADIFLGVKGGVGEQEDNLKDIVSNNYSYSDSKSIIGAEAGIETHGDSKHRFGLKAGLNSYGKIDSEDKSIDKDLVLKNTLSVPLTVYYKYAPKDTGVHLWIGAGATWASLKFQDDIKDVNDTESQIFPHAAAGIEWRIIELIGIGIDLTYNFDAKVKSHGMYRDFTGLEGMAAVRLYLF
ncbi:hypothetical protein AAIR98_000981 [Elusimicrobium simillimum]|uniref:outer membrane beta-barrel protein n=1 Tax=Elusimicrobium simillimum TaxID=3143438 RepID=UPI003C6F970A